MIIIACIDTNNGMLFNHRRQSRDRILIQHIVEITDGRKIWMNSYSAGLFSNVEADKIIADSDFLDKAGAGDYCFVENESIVPYEDKIEKIILYKWNRHYPADSWFTLDLTSWNLTESEDFSGSSHEKITMEVYKKCN